MGKTNSSSWISAGLLAAAMLCHGVAWGQDQSEEEAPPNWTLGWLLFGDLQWVPTHHLPEGDGSMGAVLRRGYLTLDFDLTDHWFGRARLELNQSGEFEVYEYEVDFKDLHVGRTFGEHELLLGLSPTLTFDVIERFWGRRYLMRTPMDLQGVPSRDTGIALRGPLNASGTLGYRAMWGMDTDFGNESSDDRKVMLAMDWQPGGGWLIDLYFDRQNKDGPKNHTTWQGFVGWANEEWRWGLQYSNQDRETDAPLELASGFIIKTLYEDTHLVVRVDRIIEPSPRGDNISYIPFDPSAPATMLLAGFEQKVSEHITVTPNLIAIRYDQLEDGSRPENDLYFRFTLFFNFE